MGNIERAAVMETAAWKGRLRMRSSNDGLKTIENNNGLRQGKGTASSRIYQMLSDQIIQVALLPGSTMSEQETADRLGVSRTPVREAFIRLARERMLVISPQKRTMVAKISLKRAVQERFLRESLERSVFEELLQKPSREAVDALHKALEGQKLAIAKKDPAAFLFWDDAFHQVFYETTGNMLCYQVIQQNCFDYYRIRRLSSSVSDIQKLNIQEHEIFLEAVQNQDIGTMEALLKKHVRRIFQEIKQLQKQHPAFFEE